MQIESVHVPTSWRVDPDRLPPGVRLEPVPLPDMPSGPSAMVSVDLLDIQTIRDRLAQLRHHHKAILPLFHVVAGLYDRLLRQAQQ